MEITIEKKEKTIIETLKGYKHLIVKENEESILIEIAMSDADNLAKEVGEGEYYMCSVTRYGNTEVKDIFYNWLTDEWEYEETYHADVRELNDDEKEEFNKDTQLNEDAINHPRYSEYKEYCNNWQRKFNSQYSYHNGNKIEAKKIMGNGPVSFAEFLKID